MKKWLLCCFICAGALLARSQELLTPFEKSDGLESASFEECTRFYQQLDAKYKQIKVVPSGMTDAGYPLQVVYYSPSGNFSKEFWKKPTHIRILINNGIHPGEPDGIDATMMLMRDLAQGKIKSPPNVLIAAISVYNIGGALNRGSYSRVNQNGPLAYGFRGNAQNLDLNRDFTKSDSRNSRSFAAIFHDIDPDILMDNHVSDGADYQHTMTLLTTQQSKLGAPLGEFLRNQFEHTIYISMENRNWGMCPYVNFETANPDKGWTAFYDPPRYSSGYAALFQCIGFVPETHMLKPFKDRVQSTYTLMHVTAEAASLHAAELRQARNQAIAEVKTQTQFPLSWKPDTSRYAMILFKGYATATTTSEATGLPRMYYDHSKPFSKTIRFYNYFLADKVVKAPKAYIIPAGWHAVIDLLKLNGVEMKELKKDSTILVNAYRIDEFKSRTRPYEKHHGNYDVKVSKTQQEIRFLKGDQLIYLNQRANRFIVEMLEPTGDDSYFAWNFFDAILQQKEGYSDYRWEELAAAWLKSHPELQAALEEKKKQDEKFAKSSSAQLDFIYKNSPWYEPAHLRYPVYRVE